MERKLGDAKGMSHHIPYLVIKWENQSLGSIMERKLGDAKGMSHHYVGISINRSGQR